MDTAGGAVTVPSIVAANRTPSSNVIINANQSNNSHQQHHNSLIHSHSSSSSSNNSNSSLINGVGGGSSNSSSSSSSTSSNSSGYGSTSATPTNSYESHAAATTPVAIAEPIPIATVAAVSPFYSEAITTQAIESQHYSSQHQQQQQQHPQHHHLQQQHQQQQHLNSHSHSQSHQQLQQNIQHTQSQQYYSTYDYTQQHQQQQQQSHQQHQQQETQQQLPQQQQQAHNLSSTYNMGSGSAAFDGTSATSPPGVAYQQQDMAHQYKATGVVPANYERQLSGRSAQSSSSARATAAANYQQHLQNETAAKPTTLSQHHQQFLGVSGSSSKSRSSTSLLGSSSSSSSTTVKPQATATAFYAQPLSQQQSSNTTSFYDQLKHKMPLDYHDNFANFPNAAAYHQQQKYYAAAKSQLKEAVTYGSSAALSGKSLYHNTNNFYVGASAQHAASLPTAGYDKYMYPGAYPSLGYETTPETAYRKASAAGSLNSPTWPWGIEYASGNSRTIPPPTGHLPTATVAPTHASYLAANTSHLARDPYYMAHEKYGMKYDKYPPSYQQPPYVSPPATRHHLWPGTHAPLNERLAPPPPHALHTTSPYFPANTPSALNAARQSCCAQPYQAQSCYYPPGRLAHGQPPAAPMGQASAYMASQSAAHNQPHLSPLGSSCKYGSAIDYGTGSKLRNPNDLYLSSHYDANAPPPHLTHPRNYQYGSAAAAAAAAANNQLYSSNQMHHGQQPAGPLIAHDPPPANSATYSSDLSLPANAYDTYLHEPPSHMGMPSGPTAAAASGYAPSAAKRALLDYRKPIQPQPPPPPQIQDVCYTQPPIAASTPRDHYQQSTELLNTPETNTAFNEYDTQSQASGYTPEEAGVALHDTDSKTGEEATKNLSLRDFIANWNDDEEDYAAAATEVMSFDQSTVINEVLQTSNPERQASMEQIPPLIPDKVRSAESDSKMAQITKHFTDSTSSSLNDADANQYVNLPDIIIDIEKSNVNSSITTPPNTDPSIDNSSLTLDNFDVEKELDQLQQMRKLEIESVIVKPSHHEDSASPTKDTKADIKPNNAEHTKSRDSDPHHHAKSLTTQISFDDLNLDQTKAVLTTRPHISATNSTDIEGYDSGNSRNSNESSLFEKEYETFINKITTNCENVSKAEKDFEQKVQDFSKFYKRKRKLKDEEVKTPQTATQQNKKKLKSADEEKVNNSNFPRVYTKKSRNRQQPIIKRLKTDMARRKKPSSVYYKLVHSWRRYRLHRHKRVRDYIDELKEKHLPLIKRQSIKNYSIGMRSDAKCFNPLPLKTLVLTVINSDEFRGRIMMTVEEYPEAEEKHICVDPSCETCEVIRSLMEPETVQDPEGSFANEIVDISNLSLESSVIPISPKRLLTEVTSSESPEASKIILIPDLGYPSELYPISSELPEKTKNVNEVESEDHKLPSILEYEVLNLQKMKHLSDGAIKTNAMIVDQEKTDCMEVQDLSIPQTPTELPHVIGTPDVDETQLSDCMEVQDLSIPQTPTELPQVIGTPDVDETHLSEDRQHTEPKDVQTLNINSKTDEESESRVAVQVDSPQATSVIRKHASNSAERDDDDFKPKRICTASDFEHVPKSTEDKDSSNSVINSNISANRQDTVQLTTVIRKIESKTKIVEDNSKQTCEVQDVEHCALMPTADIVSTAASDHLPKSQFETEVPLHQRTAQTIAAVQTSQDNSTKEAIEDKTLSQPPISSEMVPLLQVTAQTTTVIRKHETNPKKADAESMKDCIKEKLLMSIETQSKLQPNNAESSESETYSSSSSTSDSSDEGEESQDSSDSDSDSDSDSENDNENKTLKTLIKVVEKCEKLSKSSTEAHNHEQVLSFCGTYDHSTQDSFKPTSDTKEITETNREESEFESVNTKESSKDDEELKAKEKIEEHLQNASFEIDSDKESPRFSELEDNGSESAKKDSAKIIKHDPVEKENSMCDSVSSSNSSDESDEDNQSSDSEGDIETEKGAADRKVNLDLSKSTSSTLEEFPIVSDRSMNDDDVPAEEITDNTEEVLENHHSVAGNISEIPKKTTEYETTSNTLLKSGIDMENLFPNSPTKILSDDDLMDKFSPQNSPNNVDDDEVLEKPSTACPVNSLSVEEHIRKDCPESPANNISLAEDLQKLNPESPADNVYEKLPEVPAHNICDGEDVEKHSPEIPANNMSDDEDMGKDSPISPANNISFEEDLPNIPPKSPAKHISSDLEKLSAQSPANNLTDDGALGELSTECAANNICHDETLEKLSSECPKNNMSDDEALEKLSFECASNDISDHEALEQLSSECAANNVSDEEALEKHSSECPENNICDDEALEKLSSECPANNVSDEEALEKLSAESNIYLNKDLQKPTPESAADNLSDNDEKLSPASPGNNVSDDEDFTSMSTESPAKSISEDCDIEKLPTGSPKNDVRNITDESSSSTKSNGLNGGKADTCRGDFHSNSPPTLTSKSIESLRKEEVIDLSEDTSSSEDSEEDESYNESLDFQQNEPDTAPMEGVTQIVDITEDSTSEEDSDFEEPEENDNRPGLSKPQSPIYTNDFYEKSRSSSETYSDDSEFENDDDCQLIPARSTIQEITVLVAGDSQVSKKPQVEKEAIIIPQNEREPSLIKDNTTPVGQCDRKKMAKTFNYESVIKSTEVLRTGDTQEQRQMNRSITPVLSVEETCGISKQSVLKLNICGSEAPIEPQREENKIVRLADDHTSSISYHSVEGDVEETSGVSKQSVLKLNNSVSEAPPIPQKEESQIVRSADDHTSSTACHSVVGNVEETSVACHSVVGDVNETSVASHSVVGDIEETSVACHSVVGDVEETFVTYHSVVGDVEETSVARHSVVEDVEETSVTYHSVVGDVEENSVHSVVGDVEETSVACHSVVGDVEETSVACHSVVGDNVVPQKEEAPAQFLNNTISDQLECEDDNDMETSKEFIENALDDVTNIEGDASVTLPESDCELLESEDEPNPTVNLPDDLRSSTESTEDCADIEKIEPKIQESDTTKEIEDSAKCGNSLEDELGQPHLNLEATASQLDENDLMKCGTSLEDELVQTHLNLEAIASQLDENNLKNIFDSINMNTLPDLPEESMSSEDSKTIEPEQDNVNVPQTIRKELPKISDEDACIESPEEENIYKPNDMNEQCQNLTRNPKLKPYVEEFEPQPADEDVNVDDKSCPPTDQEFIREDFENEALDLSKDSKIFEQMEDESTDSVEHEQTNAAFHELCTVPCQSPPPSELENKQTSLNIETESAKEALAVHPWAENEFPKSPAHEEPTQMENDYSMPKVSNKPEETMTPKEALTIGTAAQSPTIEESILNVSNKPEESIMSPFDSLQIGDASQYPTIEELTELPHSPAIEEPNEIDDGARLMQVSEAPEEPLKVHDMSLKETSPQPSPVDESTMPQIPQNQSDNDEAREEQATETLLIQQVEAMPQIPGNQSDIDESREEQATASLPIQQFEAVPQIPVNQSDNDDSREEQATASLPIKQVEAVPQIPVNQSDNDESREEQATESLPIQRIEDVPQIPESLSDNDEARGEHATETLPVQRIEDVPQIPENQSDNDEEREEYAAETLPIQRIDDVPQIPENQSDNDEAREEHATETLPIQRIEDVPQIPESQSDNDEAREEQATETFSIQRIEDVSEISKDNFTADNFPSSSLSNERSRDSCHYSNSSSSNPSCLDISENSESRGLVIRPLYREASPEMNFWNTKGKYHSLRTYRADTTKSPTNLRNDESQGDRRSRLEGSAGKPETPRSESAMKDHFVTTVRSQHLPILSVIHHATTSQTVAAELEDTTSLQNSKLGSPLDNSKLSSLTTEDISSQTLDKTTDDVSADFLGFKNQSSFDDGSEDFNGFEDQHEEERIRREIENLHEDSAANDAFPYAVTSLSGHSPARHTQSKSPELDELEALEKELSQHRPHSSLVGDVQALNEAEELELETEPHLVSVSNVIISTNDIEHIKKMLESDEEQPNDEPDVVKDTKDKRTKKKDDEGVKSENFKENISPTNICIIPKLSDLCRAALNSSLNVNNLTIVQSNDDEVEEEQTTTTTTSTTPLNQTPNIAREICNPSVVVVERELSVEEALAEMYRQAGVLLSDPEDNDNDKATATTATATNEEAQDVLLINLHEILNSDNDVYVLQCDMNVNDDDDDDDDQDEDEVNDNAGHCSNTTHGNGNTTRATTAERVNTLQLIGILNTDRENSEIHIISSDSESEVIILSDCDTDVEFQAPEPPRQLASRPPPRDYIPFINDLDTNDSLSDLSTIHHEEIVPDNLHKFLQQEFYKYLHEKYAQKKQSKYYHANRVLRKYKKRVSNKFRQ